MQEKDDNLISAIDEVLFDKYYNSRLPRRNCSICSALVYIFRQ